MINKKRYAALLAVAGAWALAGPASAGAGDGVTAGAHDRIFGAVHAPVADPRLDEMRGGIALPDGIIDVGVTVDGEIKGQDLTDVINFKFTKSIVSDGASNGTSEFRVDGDLVESGSFEDGSVRVAVDDGAGSVQTVVQTGSGVLSGSAINSSARGVLTAVQNNLNNIDIDVTNTIAIRTDGDIAGTDVNPALRRVGGAPAY